MRAQMMTRVMALRHAQTVLHAQMIGLAVRPECAEAAPHSICVIEGLIADLKTATEIAEECIGDAKGLGGEI